MAKDTNKTPATPKEQTPKATPASAVATANTGDGVVAKVEGELRKIEGELSSDAEKAKDAFVEDATEDASAGIGAVATATETLRTKLGAEAEKAISELHIALHTVGVKIAAAEEHISGDLSDLVKKIKAHL